MSTEKKLYAGKVTINSRYLLLIFRFNSVLLMHCYDLVEKEGVISPFIFFGWWSYLSCWTARSWGWDSKGIIKLVTLYDWFFSSWCIYDYACRVIFQCLILSSTFQSISAYSGHYRPTDETLGAFLSYLRENGVNLDEVEVIDYLQNMFMTWLVLS